MFADNVISEDVLVTSDSQSSPSKWRIFLFLSLIGFFASISPSEPYLTKYLREEKHLTEGDLDNNVWPYDTYGEFIFMLPVGILAEIIGYRTVVVIGLICREATSLILLYGNSLWMMSVMQLTYASSTCINTVYYAYVYMAVSKDLYQDATSYIHAMYHFGHFLGCILAQVLVDYAGVRHHLQYLFYISWLTTTIGCLSFLLLPGPSREPPPSLTRLLFREPRNLKAQLKQMYSVPTVIQWSVWWIFGFGASSIIMNYYQNQFYQIEPEGSFGYVQAAMELFFVVGSVLPSFMEAFVTNHAAFVIGTSSLIMACLYYFSTICQSSVYYSYAFNISAVALYGFQCVAASAAIAYSLGTPRYVILFTLNSFVAYGIAFVIQQVGANSKWLTDDYYIAATVVELVVVFCSILNIIWYFFRLKQSKNLQDENGVLLQSTPNFVLQGANDKP